MSIRPVKQTLSAQKTMEGAGVELYRAFGFKDPHMADPFLLFDDFRNDSPEKYMSGFPWHPHRGIETITYVLAGSVDHGDSLGNRGSLGAGDVQWMTAGSGIMHQEMPKGDAKGQMHGFQLWANLPSSLKMTAPRYQDIQSSEIPEVVSDDGLVKARVIAGECMGVSAVIDTMIPISYIHFSLQPRGEICQEIPSGQNCLLYCFAGAISVGSGGSGSGGAAEQVEVGDGQLAVMGDGDSVEISHFDGDVAEVLLLAGEPTGEPVARYGPFVMNTQREIMQAINDFQNGTLVA